MLQNSVFNSSKTIDHKALALLLRDHGTLTPVAFCPAALIGCDGSREDKSRFNAQPVTTQKYHYHFVSVIASLGVQPRFWLIPLIAHSLTRGHGGFGVNLAWYFNADTSNVPYGLVFSCQCPLKGHLTLPEEDRDINPFTTTGHWPPELRGVLRKNSKKR